MLHDHRDQYEQALQFERTRYRQRRQRYLHDLLENGVRRMSLLRALCLQREAITKLVRVLSKPGRIYD